MIEIRRNILDQTFDLTMKHGVRSVSMDDISSSLAMSKKTLYKHFTNKKNLIHEMVLATLEKDRNDVKTIVDASVDALEEIISIARHVIDFLKVMSPSMVCDMQGYYPEEWKLIEDHYHVFVYNVIRKNVERGISEGWYKEELNADMIAKMYIKLSDCSMDEMLFPAAKYKKSELYKELITYHIRAIITAEGREKVSKLEID